MFKVNRFGKFVIFCVIPFHQVAFAAFDFSDDYHVVVYDAAKVCESVDSNLYARGLTQNAELIRHLSTERLSFIRASDLYKELLSEALAGNKKLLADNPIDQINICKAILGLDGLRL
jgi:hypothetical protein